MPILKGNKEKSFFQYWGLDANEVEPCCWMTYTQHRDTQEVLSNLDKLDIDIDEERMNNPEEIYKRYDKKYIHLQVANVFTFCFLSETTETTILSVSIYLKKNKKHFFLH